MPSSGENRLKIKGNLNILSIPNPNSAIALITAPCACRPATTRIGGAPFNPFLLISNLISRLASITIMINPRVPKTGSNGLKFGITKPVDSEISEMIIPSAIKRITEGIFEYLLVISNRYDKRIMIARVSIM